MENNLAFLISNLLLEQFWVCEKIEQKVPIIFFIFFIFKYFLYFIFPTHAQSPPLWTSCTTMVPLLQLMTLSNTSSSFQFHSWCFTFFVFGKTYNFMFLQ